MESARAGEGGLEIIGRGLRSAVDIGQDDDDYESVLWCHAALCTGLEKSLTPKFQTLDVCIALFLCIYRYH